MIMPTTRRTFLGTAAAAALHGQKKPYTLTPDPLGMTLNTPDGRAACTYLARKPDNIGVEGNSACCFHPVNTPSGERVTDIAPPDHRDHRGLFFAWQSMDFRSEERRVGKECR